jgi:hypothetical protein
MCGTIRSLLIPIVIFGYLAFGMIPAESADPLPDRFVWVFGWNLNRDGDVAEISQVLEAAAEHGLNGAVMSLGLDTLCKKGPEYFRRLEQLQAVCQRLQIDMIPAVFSVGYGGAALVHNRNLAEGLPVVDAPFLVRKNVAEFLPDESVVLANGGFEDFSGNKLHSYGFHDQPGEVTFVDSTVKHGGEASLRMENFTANPHGHGRVMQEVKVRPHRCYRLSIWVKTEQLQPVNALRLQVLAGDRALAPRDFDVQPTSDWQKLTMVFNSLDLESVRLYVGMWGGKSGRLWLDDWRLEEIGPLNVLRRPGTPVRVCSSDGSTDYSEGTDYAPLEDPQYSPYRVDRPAPSLTILPGGRIQDGERLRVSWYHSQVINDSQVTVCMAEPELYEIFDHEAKLLAEKLKPRRVFLNMDEVRMGGTCRACNGRDMGRLLGECVTKQVEILRRYLPNVDTYVWSDMLDPHHNAHGDYYLVRGDFTGSWNHVPQEMIIAVWGGEPRPESLEFFDGQGFQTLAACYYDADDLQDVRRWLELIQGTKRGRGMMYTPWQRKYQLLPQFGDILVREE